MVLKKRQINYTEVETLLKLLIDNKLKQLSLKKYIREQKAKLKELKKEIRQDTDGKA